MADRKKWSGQRVAVTPPDPAVVSAARREEALCTSRLGELARGHPTVKTWRARLKAAQAIIARAQ